MSKTGTFRKAGSARGSGSVSEKPTARPIAMRHPYRRFLFSLLRIDGPTRPAASTMKNERNRDGRIQRKVGVEELAE